MPYFRSYSLHFSFNTIFYCFMPHNRSNNLCVSFSTFFSFLTIIQVLECVFLIFHVFDCFWPYSRSYSVFPSFVPHNRSNNVCISFSMFFQFSHHDPGSRVCISHFSRFWLFLTVFQVIQCLCLILQLITFSLNNTGPTLCVSPFYVSHSFSPHSTSYTVCFSFSTIFIFLAILQVLQCTFLIFSVFRCFLPI